MRKLSRLACLALLGALGAGCATPARPQVLTQVDRTREGQAVLDARKNAPQAYARAELRGWIADILFDKRTEERGLFDPAFVRTLVEHHCSGLEQWTIGKIAPLVTYEMMLRRFHD